MFNKISSSIQPPNDHLESSKNYQEKYINKLHHRCEVQIKRGAEKCRQAFSKAYDKCHDKLPFIVNKLLCWPMKITFVCNIAEVNNIQRKFLNFFFYIIKIYIYYV